MASWYREDKSKGFGLKESLEITASFFSNGTCGYEVLKDGERVDRNIVGIITTWGDLLRLIAVQLEDRP